MQAPGLTIVQHPLIAHKLTHLRDKRTASAQFRPLMREVALLLAFEATRDLALGDIDIETPVERGTFPVLAGKAPCLASVLRAGNGLLDGFLDLLPSACVGHIGIARDHETLKPTIYSFTAPADLHDRAIFLLDPMLATGGTAIAAASMLKEAGARRIKLISLVAAPAGVEAFQKAHGDIAIITASLDRGLNDIGYIMPGLGDAGDRLYGTSD